MKIKTKTFVLSAPDLKRCPVSTLPEFAFIGRSNVGKSSLINMLCDHKDLAKTSGKPGKTQLMNFFLINERWHLVDLPGYGFAKISKSTRERWETETKNYLKKRENLRNIFVLIDIRLEPQKIDLEFMQWLADHNLNFSIIFTKCDKVSSNQISKTLKLWVKELQKMWQELPHAVVSSSETGVGKDEILGIIEAMVQDSEMG
ncbi:MAG: ribosome biogenesis GTP-binding protein YihA/YsxC [Bacteroidales bacterium]|nr:ribosome biogenesis GTP-binding protein YihA/YsxC [Bacteroidales bacterium]